MKLTDKITAPFKQWRKEREQEQSRRLDQWAEQKALRDVGVELITNNIGTTLWFTVKGLRVSTCPDDIELAADFLDGLRWRYADWLKEKGGEL